MIYPEADTRERLVEILLVEDNPGDVRLAREALAPNDEWHNLSVVNDGVEAMAYLRREGKFGGAARPDLILLDLNLPRKNGREVLPRDQDRCQPQGDTSRSPDDVHGRRRRPSSVSASRQLLRHKAGGSGAVYEGCEAN